MKENTSRDRARARVDSFTFFSIGRSGVFRRERRILVEHPVGDFSFYFLRTDVCTHTGRDREVTNNSRVHLGDDAHR